MTTEKHATVEATAEVIDAGASVSKQAASLVDTIFDVGTAWAEYALKYGRFALKNTARALTRTAKALEALELKIKRQNEHGDREQGEAA